MSNPETCPHHPPASTLANVACRTCGAFRVKVDVGRLPRSVVALAFEVLVDIAGRDASPDDPSNVPIPVTLHHAILALLSDAVRATSAAASSPPADQGGPAREPDDVEEHTALARCAFVASYGDREHCGLVADHDGSHAVMRGGRWCRL